jgi:hypothetical protein
MKTVYHQLVALCIAAVPLLAGCSKSDNEATASGGVNAETGYCKGIVRDARQQPLSGVQVTMDNHYLPGSTINGTSGADGRYSIKLAFGTFSASAYITREYNGKIYRMELDPDNSNDFPHNEAVVRNFTWKLSGDASASQARYYGSAVTLDAAPLTFIGDPENMEFQLVPVGNLIDGSAGSTLKLKPGQPFSNDYGMLVDIPLGRYTITGTYREEGTGPVQTVRLRNKLNASSTFAASHTLDFEPLTIQGTNTAILEYELQ